MGERNVPRRFRKLYRKTIETTSRKAAIRMMCVECMGYNPKEVELCKDTGCPLFKYRLKG
jgi:hypothetical protein